MATGFRVPYSIGSYVMPKTSTHPFGPGVAWHMVNGVPVRGKSDAMIAKDANAAIAARSAGLANYYSSAPPTPEAAATMGVIPDVTPGYTSTNTVIDSGGVPTAAPGYTQETPGAPPAPTPETKAAIAKQKFNDWLANDQAFGSARQAFQTAGQSAHNNLRDLIRSKLIAAGIKIDPSTVQSELSGYGDSVDQQVGSALGEALDPATLATAQTNPGSAMAGLTNALAAGKQDLRNLLAARGLLGQAPSAAGSYVDEAGNVQSGFENVLKNAFNVGTQNLGAQLLSDIRTGIAGTGGYIPSQLAAQGLWDQAQADAATRYANLPV